MVRLALSVEGTTEFEFCRELLQPHLRAYGVQAQAKIVVTKRNISGPNSKGGDISLQRVITEVRPLLSSFDYVTTLYDFYGFKHREPNETPAALCERIQQALDTPMNFLPYVQVYEFEALVFSNPAKVGQYEKSSDIAQDMQRVVASCGGAEKINDNPLTAPSKRLKTIFEEHKNLRYDKNFHGLLLALEIGLDSMRQACPRFNDWLLKLENIPR